MKKTVSLLFSVCLIFMLCACSADGIKITAENFPDENFRSYLLELDEGKDEVLTNDEIENIRKLDVHDSSISDLTGIQYFTSLEVLDCSENTLKTLDISGNSLLFSLACADNQLEQLDLSNNPKLKELSCGGNRLSTLDISHNPKLSLLYCKNNLFDDVDISNNPELLYFRADFGQFDLSCKLSDLSTELKAAETLEYKMVYPPRLYRFVKEFTSVLAFFNSEMQQDFYLGSLEYEQNSPIEAKMGWDGCLTASYGPNGKEFGILAFVDDGEIKSLISLLYAPNSISGAPDYDAMLAILFLPAFLFNEELQNIPQLFLLPQTIVALGEVEENEGGTQYSLTSEQIKDSNIVEYFGENLSYSVAITSSVCAVQVLSDDAVGIPSTDESSEYPFKTPFESTDTDTSSREDQSNELNIPANESSSYTGTIEYIGASDAGYYCMKLDQPINYNGNTHMVIAFPQILDGGLDASYLNVPVTVRGKIYEDYHGILCIDLPEIT